MIRLVDTSCWTQFIRRRGDPGIRAAVQELLSQSQAAWCDPIRLEWWNGTTTDFNRQILEELERTVPVLPITASVWQRACELAYQARTSGLNVPANDLLIFACAQEHRVDLEHNDRHYRLLEEMLRRSASE